VNHAVTVAGYAMIAAGIAGSEIVARTRNRVPTFSDALALVTRWPPARWLLTAGWLWLGWHVFVRGNWR